MTDQALPAATVIHAGEGRTRLRIASRREDPVFFASVESGLSAIPGVRGVRTTPLTGSILIFHDAPLRSLAEEAEKRRLFSLAAETPAGTAAAPAPVAQIDPRMALAAGLGVIALWQAYREKYFPSALSVAMQAIAVAGLLPANGATPAARD